MKAVIWHGPGDVRYEEKAIPSICEDEVLIKVAYTGICGSEIHIIDGHLPVSRIAPPQVLGHEFSGTIAQLGQNVTDFKIGDRVTAHPWVGCGECHYCRQAQEHFCTNPFNVLSNPRAGSWAEYTAVKAKQVYSLPQEMSLEIAALVEPFSIGLHAMDISNIRAGYSAVVLGAGVIGLACLQVAQRVGATLTIVSDLSDSRLELARKLGADIVVNPSRRNLRDAVLEATGGLGVHTCIEAVGVKATCEAVSYTHLTLPTN